MMADEDCKSSQELIDNLNSLRKSVILAEDIRKDREAITNLYNNEILPHLLQIRRLNRISKDKLEEKHDRIRELNRKLISSHQVCNNLLFEASCLRYEVDNAKGKLSPKKSQTADPQGDIQMTTESEMQNNEDFFDIVEVSRLDHDTRTKLLEEEEAKRKRLRDELTALTAETSDIELVCESGEKELNQVKPFIKQLIDKAPFQPNDAK